MEIQILHWFESLHNPITDPIMYFITTLGNGGIFWIILAVAMLIILPKRYKKVGLSMAIALILSLIFCNGIMKHMWARPRAFWVEGQNFVISNNFENLYGLKLEQPQYRNEEISNYKIEKILDKDFEN